MAVIPVILSGGSGTRLWPLSHRDRPKQFLRFGSTHTLFQETALRCRAGLFDPRPVVVGAADHRFLLAEDLREIGIAADILLEPVARNSCAAIAAGCLRALARDRDAMVLALPADHRIPDSEAFAAAVASALADAEAGALVTFGVAPDRPSSAYGYVLAGEPLMAAARVKTFVEKPSAETAARHVADGYLWNSGKFLFRADAFMAELSALAPDVAGAVSRAVGAARAETDFLWLDGEAFARSPSIAVDYAVMERTERAAVLPVDYGWTDIGSWDAVAGVLDTDSAGNAVVGEAVILDGRNNLVHSEGTVAALIGVDDMVVVATPEGLLVAPKARAEEVRLLASHLAGDEGTGRTPTGQKTGR
ncbi:mannose-1-phosphate guanylyltransferase [Kaustia mangrovi]|uniref:Mannose-1-phosphate guanylyltransferase n=1 Tax=Kaustia mangrovi TaxID=2593653 RepID=A0A7S8HCN8_9HYPH|nr:mannose-1-phosphate guanylyltransferase [Kaustia mangrovi]QPC43453.1 mannose-1-phosphate guanylyltransferase [Kaustia mangrovi]